MTMIKTFCIYAAAMLALSGCMTSGTGNTPRGEVPAARIHIKEMTAPTAGNNPVLISREPRMGMGFGADAMEFSINYVAFADLEPGESISAWLPDGDYTFSVKPLNNSERLAPTVINVPLSKGRPHSVRMGGNQFKTTLEEVGK
jgi:hypothetical protein